MYIKISHNYIYNLKNKLLILNIYLLLQLTHILYINYCFLFFFLTLPFYSCE